MTKPARTSARTYPYENLSFARHFVMTEAARPASNAVQSKNMWNESEIRPRLLVHTPYKSSTNAKDKLRMRNRKRFRDAVSEKISLNHP